VLSWVSDSFEGIRDQEPLADTIVKIGSYYRYFPTGVRAEAASELVDADVVTPVPEDQVLVHEPTGTAFDYPRSYSSHCKSLYA